jgi:energy-coupling factor transport system permease protein
MHGIAAVRGRGTSWLHRLDPAAKLAWLVPLTLYCFTTYQPLPLLGVLLGGLLLAASARILGPLLRVMAVFLPLSASIIVIQAVAPATCGGPCLAPVSLGPLSIYSEGLSHGISLVLRVTSFQVGVFAVLLTTRPPDLFASLGRLRVPYAATFMIATTLQLVPILQREVALVISAQRARGLRGSGFGALIPSFVPVAAASVERVQQLAISLEARGFGVSGPKTSYFGSSAGVADAVLGVSGTIGLSILCVYGLVNWGQAQTAVLVLPAPAAIALFLLAVSLFAGVVAAAARTVARL